MQQLLNYISEGTGKPVVFLHGFCESSEIWNPYRQHFTAEYNIICIDLPGHGLSLDSKDGITIEYMARLVYNTISSLKLENFILIGHSLGGYVTIAYAELFPDKLAGYCLFHSSAYPDTPEKKENRNKTAEYVKNHGVNAFCNPFVPGLFFIQRKEELKIKYLVCNGNCKKNEG